MSRDIDYYGLLRVAKDASEAEIRERFRAIARESHPDRAPADPALHFARLGASEPAHHRTGPGHRLDPPGPSPIIGVLIGPCSIPSASDCERRSAT